MKPNFWTLSLFNTFIALVSADWEAEHERFATLEDEFGVTHSHELETFYCDFSGNTPSKSEPLAVPESVSFNASFGPDLDDEVVG